MHFDVEKNCIEYRGAAINFIIARLIINKSSLYFQINCLIEQNVFEDGFGIS